MANKFLVSVANAVMLDPNTGNAIAYGTANLTSAFTMAAQKTDVRGGINNPLLYTYIHDRELTVSIEQATFDKVVLGLNAGQLAQNGNISVVKTDCIVLSSGSGVISSTATSNVSVMLPDGTVQTVTPSGSNIYVSAGANNKVTAIYKTLTTADQITVETVTPPSVVDLYLLAEVRDNTGVVVENLQINVPRFQVLGNFTLSLAANGVSNQKLDGNALAVASSDCTTGEYYAKVTWIPVSNNVVVSSIASIPSTITFTATSLPATQQISVLGIRGGIYANANITSSSTFSKVSGSASITVSAGGLVTAGSSGSAGHTATIGVTYYTVSTGSLIDYVIANITA